MQQLLNQLQTEWEGASSQTFENLKPSFQATKK